MAHTQERNRYSDPCSPLTTPQLACSQRQSTESRSKSFSPRKHRSKQPLHIRMNLTEMQVDRLTNAFACSVDSSPTHSRGHHSDSMPTPSFPKRDFVEASHSNLFTREANEMSSKSPAASHFPLDDTTMSNLASRRRQVPPSHIDTAYEKEHSSSSKPQRAKMTLVPEPISPLNSKLFRSIDETTRASQVNCSHGHFRHHRHDDYRENLTPPQTVQPRNIHQRKQPSQVDTWNLLIGGAGAKEDGGAGDVALRKYSLAHPQRSKSTGEGLILKDVYPTYSRPDGGDMAHRAPLESTGNELFSPLTFYFRDSNFPAEKKGEKTMIGQNGWLERTEELSDQRKKTPTKRPGIIDGIKRIAKDMSGLHYPHRRPNSNPRESLDSHLAISLNAREQSLLYCELEFHLTNSLNSFINSELDKGNLVPNHLKKIADAWFRMGRPRVVGFRYDLETQIELVHLHINDFSFYGRWQGNILGTSGLLDAMKTNARAMRTRTFCQPDSVIAKQLVDGQSMFELIHASKSQQTALYEIAQFFKVIVEREKVTATQRHQKDVFSHLPDESIGSPLTKEHKARGRNQSGFG